MGNRVSCFRPGHQSAPGMSPRPREPGRRRPTLSEPPGRSASAGHRAPLRDRRRPAEPVRGFQAEQSRPGRCARSTGLRVVTYCAVVTTHSGRGNTRTEHAVSPYRRFRCPAWLIYLRALIWSAVYARWADHHEHDEARTASDASPGHDTTAPHESRPDAKRVGVPRRTCRVSLRTAYVSVSTSVEGAEGTPRHPPR